MTERPRRIAFPAFGCRSDWLKAISTSAFCVVAALVMTADADAAVTLDKALGIQPVQPSYKAQPIDADTRAKLKVVDYKQADGRGWEVVGPGGQVFRRFIDTDGNGRMDRWCYFEDGVESYRDIDLDGDANPDEYRWLGIAGSKWGIDENEDGVIDRWKQISPEEVSAEVVAAVANADADRFAAVVLSPSELKRLGVGEELAKTIEAKCTRAISDFAALAKRQRALTPDCRWLQFAAMQPGVLPAGTNGSTKDLVAYENVVAMYTRAVDGKPGEKKRLESGQLMIGTVIQVDNGWRVISLPSVGDAGESVAQLGGTVFNVVSAPMDGEEIPGGISEAAQKLYATLEQLDRQLASAQDAKEASPLHARRSDIIEALIEQAATEQERENWVRQLVDTMSVAVQTGQYPDGVNRLRKIAPTYATQDRTLAAYADYAAIGSNYVVRQSEEKNFAKVQQWYLDALQGFVKRYPKTVEGAKSLLQLALAKEFDGDADAAVDYYQNVVDDFEGTPEAYKAAGAIRRLQSNGKVITLQGKMLDGRDFNLASLKGRPVIVQYWATWCEPCKQDMKLLRRLSAAYARSRLTLVGVNVDARREDAVTYVKEEKLPGYQLFEEGGLEQSRLANQLGVQTLPTIMLIGPDGRVVRQNVPSSELESELEKLLRRKKK